MGLPGDAPWWQSAVFYQIWPRCFADGNGDGVGDLIGVRNKLDYLAWLGIDAIWLSPFYPSPQADFGYDVADYCAVDPAFGSMEDFDDLVRQAHDRHIRVIIDWVPNHTSDAHPWFVESRSSRTSAKRDYYVWRDSRPGTAEPGRKGEPPNNWGEAFGDGPAWTWDEHTGQWYLHLFLSEQPDLNWHDPRVEDSMAAVVSFWLDRGVDGLRMDVVHLIGKDPALPDLPATKAGRSVVAYIDDPATHPMLRRLRHQADSYDHHPVLVGEVILRSADKIAQYYGESDELHLAFYFPAMWIPWDQPAWTGQLEQARQAMGPRRAWPTWVLSNHDNPRHRTRYGGSEARARAAAVLLTTLRGTPFLYAGEELGLEDAIVADEERRDPGGRDGARAPLPWDSTPDHGWVPSPEWPVWPPEPERRNPVVMGADPGSILNLYRTMLQRRKGSVALRLGTFETLAAPEGVLAFARRSAVGSPAIRSPAVESSGVESWAIRSSGVDGQGTSDVRVVLVNFTDQAHSVPPGADWPSEGLPGWTVSVDSSDTTAEGGPYLGRLAPSAGVVLTVSGEAGT